MDNDRENGADRAASGISRGQNQLHFVPEDWHAAASVIFPLTERLDESGDATQMIVITGDVDAAAGVGTRLSGRLADGRHLRLLSATDARRALRVLRRTPPHILIGTPELFAELVQKAALKLDDVRVAVLAWLDGLDGPGTQALEAVMTEVPKDAVRIVTAADASPGVEQLVERYARRARRIQSDTGQSAPVSVSYLAVGDVARPMALRRVLDALDPDSAFVVVTTQESRAEVAAHLHSLGYRDDAYVRFGETPPADGAAQVVVLYDFPASAEQLRFTVAAAPSARIVAFAAPRQLSTLRRWGGGGGTVTPLVLPDAAIRARSREAAVRDEIRGALASGGFSREVIALEPLLNEHDGVEIAAALLRMLEAERARVRTGVAAAPEAASMIRLFINVGEMDGVRPGDLVGAITNEAGISKAELGRVDIRERHSTVEVATPVANAVVSKLTGVSIRGRRALVKIDEGRERRDSEGGGRRERGDARDARRDRGSSRPTRPPRSSGPPSRTR